MEADRQAAEAEHQKTEDKKQVGLQRIADIQGKRAVQQVKAAASHTLRPRPRAVAKAASPSKSQPGGSSRVQPAKSNSADSEMQEHGIAGSDAEMATEGEVAWDPDAGDDREESEDGVMHQKCLVARTLIIDEYTMPNAAQDDPSFINSQFG
ncbi:hypothetical protein BV22DRAFT_1050687 [Leucogyrophana mollusca]|uniref:Uncharacterized protein n=1 Tax=Leucogyrophana mollusca TaxID=85980 RepID=A0ACB8B2J0_9AGAM|nr:hypothetical protein BV22DRAFT_1050687 [Leucogyrophana mollusca]